MKILNPFGPKIGATKVSNQLVEMLYNEGQKIREDEKKRKDHDYRRELAGNLAEEYRYGDLMSDELRHLLELEVKSAAVQYLSAVSRVIQKDATVPFEKMVFSETWVNFMKQGEWNPRHCHGGYVSLVIFLRVPKEIALENTTEESVKSSNFPTAGMLEFTYGEMMDLANCSANIIPKQGDMYLFPSALFHQVYPFVSDAERVSVSLNIYYPELAQGIRG